MLDSFETSADECAAFLSKAGERQARFLRALIPVFLAECPELLGSIRQAIAAGNAVALRHAAHTLKGSLGFFGGKRVIDLAQQLEALGKSGDLTGAAELRVVLEKSIEAMLPVLADYARPTSG